ncbi:MAG TPA: hypothetical protein V6C58_19225 [Allocoleopsis sp.]
MMIAHLTTLYIWGDRSFSKYNKVHLEYGYLIIIAVNKKIRNLVSCNSVTHYC